MDFESELESQQKIHLEIESTHKHSCTLVMGSGRERSEEALRTGGKRRICSKVKGHVPWFSCPTSSEKLDNE